MGYCPECGFSINPDSPVCSYCGNRKFHMTVRVFWDNCDKCSADASLGDGNGSGNGKSSCRTCSGVGFRKYRVLKDARSGLLYYERFDAVLLRYHEERERL